MEPVRALFFCQWAIAPVDWQAQACGLGMGVKRRIRVKMAQACAKSKP